MKIKTIPFAVASAIALTSLSGAAMAGTGTATAEVTAMPPALSVQEIQAYQMQIERAPGATMPTSNNGHRMAFLKIRQRASSLAV